MINTNFFDNGDTLASRIANAVPELTTKLETASLFYLAAILLASGSLANLAAQLIVRRGTINQRRRALMAIAVETANPLGPSGNLRRRKRVDRFDARRRRPRAAVLAVGVLVIVISSIAVQGAQRS